MDWDIGDMVPVTSPTFRNAAGVPTNPTTVTLRLRAPDGVTTSVTPTPGTTGIYTADIAPDQAGVWRYRWAGTGAVTTAEEGWFTVRRRRVT